jgi:hypothetical protein
MNMTVNLERPQKNIQSQINDSSRKAGRVSNQLSQFDDLHQAQQFLGIAPRNFIINPSGSVAQRGTTGTKISNSYGGYLSVDRWAVYYAGTILSQESPEVVNGILDNFIRCEAGSTGGRIYMYQKIENGSAIFGGGASFSLSFWARGNAGYELSIGTRYYDNASTGGEAVKTHYNAVEITEGWKYYEFNGLNHVDASRNATRDFGLWLVRNDNSETASNEDYLDVCQVQFQLGPSVSPFIPRDKEQELSLCQRYYQVLIDNANGQRPVAAGRANSGTAVEFQLPLTVGMRDITSLPQSNMDTIYLYSGGARVNTTSGTVVLNDDYLSGSSYAYLRTTGASVTDDRAYTIGGFLADAHLAVDGELS